MGVGETLGCLDAEPGSLGLAELHVVVEHVPQAAAAQVLEHQVGPIGVLTPVEDPKDMGVVEGGHRAGLGAEALEEGLVLGQPRLEHLYGDKTLQRHVFGEEDVRRRASAQGGDQPVPLPEDPADGIGDEGHRSAPRLAGLGGGAVDTPRRGTKSQPSVPGQAGNSPVARSWSKACPATTGTPRASALASLAAPGSAPTTRANVRAETLSG